MPLTRDERQGTQVFALEFKDVECIEARRASAIQQRFELTLSVTIQTDDLAVQHGILDVEALGDLFGQGREPLVNIASARDELAAAGLHIGDGAEAVMFDLEHPFRMIEGRGSAAERHRLEREDHLGESIGYQAARIFFPHSVGNSPGDPFFLFRNDLCGRRNAMHKETNRFKTYTQLEKTYRKILVRR